MGFIFRCNVYVLKTYIDLETAVLDKTQLDPLTYRDAMSRLAGHVHIVTAAHRGVRRGVTITAACSVSDDPATLLVCLNGANPRNDIFAESGCFGLNLLGADQMDLAHVFSGKNHVDPSERFFHGSWGELKTGAPILGEAVAAFDCRLIDIKTVPRTSSCSVRSSRLRSASRNRRSSIWTGTTARYRFPPGSEER